MHSHRQTHDRAPEPAPPLQHQEPGGPGNAARLARSGVGASAPPPTHELGGPLAGLLLDALPLDEAVAAAAAWLDNPAVAAWWRAHGPASVEGEVAAAALDAVWPAGLALTLEGDLGGHLTGGLETEAAAAVGREADGRATAEVRTRAGVSLTQAVGTREEDAFGQVEVARRLEAAGLLTVDVLWDLDGVVLGGPRLATALCAPDPARAAAEAVVPLALEAAPDVALEAGVRARADLTADALDTHGLRTPVRTLLSPLLARADGVGSALVQQATRVEALGAGLIELRLALEGSLSADVEAALSTLPALILPEQLAALSVALGAGARCVVGARVGLDGAPVDAWMELGTDTAGPQGASSRVAVARSPDEVAALLGQGDAPVERRSTVSRALTEPESAVLQPLVARALGGALGVGSALPDVQHLDALRLEATGCVPAAAIARARAAGLGGLPAAVEADAILAAAAGAPLPAGADAEGAAAGAAALPAAPRLLLRGRVALGAGGSMSVGAVEDASATARARAGMRLDHPVPPADAESVLRDLLGAGPQSSRLA